MVMWEWVVVGGRCRRRRRSELDVLYGDGEEGVNCGSAVIRS